MHNALTLWDLPLLGGAWQSDGSFDGRRVKIRIVGPNVERGAQSVEQTWEQTRETLEHAHHSVDERSFDIPISSALGKEGIEPTYATVILLGVLKLRGKTFKAKTSLSVRGGKDVAACCLLFDLRQCLALSEELLGTDGGSRGR